ncbi:SDR family oxidoreductase [Streptomyces sp. NPDC029721]|uniref:SDR family oxidoreductase n=1 Tax=Streptomyces sp. NPDC029721 TaxID=3157090 RepID=UPI0033C792A7
MKHGLNGASRRYPDEYGGCTGERSRRIGQSRDCRYRSHCRRLAEDHVAAAGPDDDQLRREPAGLAPYAAAKAALTTYSKGPANEVAPHGVRVNTVSSGFVQTSAADDLVARISLGRPNRPEEVAERVAFLVLNPPPPSGASCTTTGPAPSTRTNCPR